jgi:hypothetical protein
MTWCGDGSIDLLFFHRGLNCLVAIELKITTFEHAHIGQLNFYHLFALPGILNDRSPSLIMRTRQLILGRPDLSGEIEERYRNESDVRSKVRLLCIKLAASGDYTSEQVADICGKSQSSIFVWLKAFREYGFEGLLEALLVRKKLYTLSTARPVAPNLNPAGPAGSPWNFVHATKQSRLSESDAPLADCCSRSRFASSGDCHG